MTVAEINRLADELGIAALDPLAGNFAVPTNANSEFMANRAMGDWAEGHVEKMVADAGFRAVGYGEDNSMAAGEEGFREMYLENRQIQQQYGKKPDVLVFDHDVAQDLGLPDDLRSVALGEQHDLVRQALAGLEVRSSKFKAKKYHEVRAAQIDGGKNVQRWQSFTPKVEDLPVIRKWIQIYGVPHLYTQVFFDEAYAISFHDILRVLNARSGLNYQRKATLPAAVDGFNVQDLKAVKVETPKNSNFKKTNMIPVMFGRKVAQVPAWEDPYMPRFETEMRETDLGRLDAFVKPVGGAFSLVDDNLRAIVEQSAW